MVHIQGPLKGEIQEFSAPEISIGRHPSCLVRFPADLTIVSREHAKIIREGNRFKLIDSSANGTFVNGKRVKEVYLRDGDVLIIAEGGPKVSFLTQVREGQDGYEETPSPAPQEDARALHNQEPTMPPPELKETSEIAHDRVSVPLVIQFGPTLRSFKKVPVNIGSHANCDFVLEHPRILDQHAQIFFVENQYWVKDLTGQNLVMINGKPINLGVPLNPNDELALSPQGPTFRFLGEGRLAEVEQ
jgi:pSer/pThr/pTyr-binding forkhead associated (FHA) protein